MKNNLIVNYLMMLITWTLYINHHTIPAVLCSIVASLLLIAKMRKMNYFRLIMVMVLCLIFFYGINSLVTVSDFYSSFNEFSFFLSINIALNNEMQNKTSANLNVLNSIITLVMVLFFVTAVLLPDAWYSIFTKSSLYALISFVFVPYEVSLVLTSLKKEVLYETVLS